MFQRDSPPSQPDRCPESARQPDHTVPSNSQQNGIHEGLRHLFASGSAGLDPRHVVERALPIQHLEERERHNLGAWDADAARRQPEHRADGLLQPRWIPVVVEGAESGVRPAGTALLQEVDHAHDDLLGPSRAEEAQDIVLDSIPEEVNEVTKARRPSATQQTPQAAEAPTMRDGAAAATREGQAAARASTEAALRTAPHQHEHVQNRAEAWLQCDVVPADRNYQVVIGSDVVPNELVCRQQPTIPVGQSSGLDCRVEAREVPSTTLDGFVVQPIGYVGLHRGRPQEVLVTVQRWSHVLYPRLVVQGRVAGQEDQAPMPPPQHRVGNVQMLDVVAAPSPVVGLHRHAANVHGAHGPGRAVRNRTQEALLRLVLRSRGHSATTAS
eukprot:CAMPEP_0175215414 /NCGR_PEP_ID=MMETSP0093-20121207/17203_1 /TAXON_ID=311494 /ORGANISM="Alexandrium monilatum, Strain CCMP3105" /LENGTH=383 /DNA_ID=CAMNT_0016508783 /DNA_START=11 /DNA_END=1158 /DNA_ORIENTATION=+